MTLTEFLSERLAEDEAEARLGDGQDFVPTGYWDNARVLAEVAAKRAVLANERAARVACGSAPLSERLAASDGPTAAYWRGQAWVLRILAAVYSDHPDYDLSWRL